MSGSSTQNPRTCLAEIVTIIAGIIGIMAFFNIRQAGDIIPLGDISPQSPPVIRPTDDTAPDAPDNSTGPSREPSNSGSSSAADLGRVVTARAIDDNNNPQGITTAFSQDDPIIYVVAEVEHIDAGTEAFARWSRSGEAFEESLPLTTDREYADTNLWFALERTGKGWQPGDYSVTILIDGQAVVTTDFTIE